jgi:predicted TIM-barrel fold metal-dependent hydrolase
MGNTKNTINSYRLNRLPVRTVSKGETEIPDEQGACLPFVSILHGMRTLFFLLVMLLSVSLSTGCLGVRSGHGKAVHPSTLTEAQAYGAIKAAFEDEWTIDNHTHIVYGAHYDEKVFGYMPLAMGHAVPEQLALAKELFGTDNPEEAAAIRDGKNKAEGGAYWIHHLDATRTRIALVNTMAPLPDTGGRMRWVPYTTYLLFPVPADNYPRDPSGADIAKRARAWLADHAAQGGQAPADLPAYLAFVDETLAAWARARAVGIKFIDGLTRTLRFSEIGMDEAAELYRKGQSQALGRDEFLRLQDYIVRHIFLKAPAHGLTVHIHAAASSPPFLQLGENDARHLEAVLTDPKLFRTQFILIHGGFPLVEEAAYLSLKPHVWIDVSALAFFYPMRELVERLRIYLIYSPSSVLFGTDVLSYPSVPGGPEAQHIVLSKKLREGLNRALAGLVCDNMITVEQAISLGRKILHENAERLYDFKG